MSIKFRKSFVVSACVVGLAAVAGSLVTAQPTKDAKPATQPGKDAKHAPAAGQPEMQLPPGWTSEDMEACTKAGTPGKMHQDLAKDVGVWRGQTTMWMGPGMDPMPKSECTDTVSLAMDGRFLKCEMAGDIPGMGPFTGLGFTGFDNVTQKYVGTWMDNHSTGIMTGVGEASQNGKVMTWNFTYNCPITKKTAVMRQVETRTSDTAKTLDMFTTDPKSGKEYKCMHIEFTKK
ncbi:MAG: DUF1579 domain-containing protein [Pyrinomonadaceae bacterium]|nr:DUF1579 domain-containing protein [Phycisphaerales bacterium]